MPSVELKTCLLIAEQGQLKPMVIRGSHLDAFEPVLISRVLHRTRAALGPRADSYRTPLDIYDAAASPDQEGILDSIRDSELPVILLLNGHKLSPSLLTQCWVELSRRASDAPSGPALAKQPLILHFDPGQLSTSKTRLAKLERLCSGAVCRLSPLGDPSGCTAVASPRSADVIFLAAQRIYSFWQDDDPLELRIVEEISEAAKIEMARPPLLSQATQELLLGYNWPNGSTELCNVIDTALHKYIAERAAKLASPARSPATRITPAAVHLEDGTKLNPILCAPPTFIEPRHLPAHIICRPIAADSWLRVAYESRLSPADLRDRYILYAHQRIHNKTLLSQIWDVPRISVTRWVKDARQSIQDQAEAHDSTKPPLARPGLDEDSTRPTPPDCANIEVPGEENDT